MKKYWEKLYRVSVSSSFLVGWGLSDANSTVLGASTGGRDSWSQLAPLDLQASPNYGGSSPRKAGGDEGLWEMI